MDALAGEVKVVLAMPSGDRDSQAASANRSGLSHDQVQDIQRARILSAMVDVAAQHGYIGAAVAPVVARAGVSRRTFYELFDGREDCFLAAFEWSAEQTRAVVVDAYCSGRSWRERVRHALAALLRFFDAHPQFARVLVVEALGAGKLVLERRGQVLRELMAALDTHAPAARGGGGGQPAEGNAPLLTAEGVVGGSLAVIHGRLLEGGQAIGGDAGTSGAGVVGVGTSGAGKGKPQLIDLHGQLMALIVLPYLGPRAAGEELTRRPPDTPSGREAGALGEDGGRLLERLDMRLTYRTVRCLVFIGANPGASNREIARGAGIPDEGQASKLLGRLARLELISNSRPPGPGQPNRWTLTPQGCHVLSAVQAR